MAGYPSPPTHPPISGSPPPRPSLGRRPGISSRSFSRMAARSKPASRKSTRSCSKNCRQRQRRKNRRNPRPTPKGLVKSPFLRGRNNRRGGSLTRPTPNAIRRPSHAYKVQPVVRFVLRPPDAYQGLVNAWVKNGQLGGYVHDTAMSQYIPPTAFHIVTGTWTQAAGAVAGTIAMHKAAAAETATVNIPIMIPPTRSA